MKTVITIFTMLLLLLAGSVGANALPDGRAGQCAEVVTAVHSCCTQQMAECARSCVAQPLSAFSALQAIWRVGLVLPAGYAVDDPQPGFSTRPTPPPRA